MYPIINSYHAYLNVLDILRLLPTSDKHYITQLSF
jgi:hypothetical protein